MISHFYPENNLEDRPYDRWWSSDGFIGDEAMALRGVLKLVWVLELDEIEDQIRQFSKILKYGLGNSLEVPNLVNKSVYLFLPVQTPEFTTELEKILFAEFNVASVKIIKSKEIYQSYLEQAKQPSGTLLFVGKYVTTLTYIEEGQIIYKGVTGFGIDRVMRRFRYLVGKDKNAYLPYDYENFESYLTFEKGNPEKRTTIPLVSWNDRNEVAINYTLENEPSEALELYFDKSEDVNKHYTTITELYEELLEKVGTTKPIDQILLVGKYNSIPAWEQRLTKMIEEVHTKKKSQEPLIIPKISLFNYPIWETLSSKVIKKV